MVIHSFDFASVIIHNIHKWLFARIQQMKVIIFFSNTLLKELVSIDFNVKYVTTNFLAIVYKKSKK